MMFTLETVTPSGRLANIAELTDPFDVLPNRVGGDDYKWAAQKVHPEFAIRQA